MSRLEDLPGIAMPLRIVIWPSFETVEIFEIGEAAEGKLSFRYGRSDDVDSWTDGKELVSVSVSPHILDGLLTELLSQSIPLNFPPRKYKMHGWMAVADGTRIFLEIGGNHDCQCKMSWVVGRVPAQWEKIASAVNNIISTLRLEIPD